MTNTELAIQKAVEGGWGIYDDVHVHPDGDIYLSIKGTNQFEYVGDVIFLDPLFWQALGKTEGWKDREYRMTTVGRGEKHVEQSRWKKEQHRLIDAIQQGRSIDEFFGEILKSKGQK
jgi:hypothetical protein